MIDRDNPPYMMSLYDYLGSAAGMKLGKEPKEGYQRQHISGRQSVSIFLNF